MPVMKQLRIGSVNYDTVGEASVTQVLASGTKIATVTIDGTSTDLYAPEGGSSVDPASAAPLMDGTAAAGTSTDYARADHVHPTDTSRAAASHTHAIADVTGLQTALDGKQPTLVSGTNIKTVNGTSLLGSGNISTAELPAVTAADNGKVLMVVGGVWQVASLPIASDNAFGVVKVDGTTITATDGVISTSGGAETYEVTITLTNPRNPSEFKSCEVHQQSSADAFPEVSERLGAITSPTGSATFAVSMPYIQVAYQGMSVGRGTVTCTGGVSYAGPGSESDIFAVTGDGTIVSDGVDYDD